jgi:hypothetical protein
MPTAPVLPPLAPFQEISRLLAWLNYLWACYQALLGNYHALQSENAQLRESAAHAEQRAAHAEQRAAHAEQRAAYAERCAAYAERCAAHRRAMNNDLLEEISNQEFCVEDAKNNAYEAEQRADEAEQRADKAEQRADKAENELNALYEQQHVENQILCELAMDESWRTSISKVNFVKKQTRLVLNTNAKNEELKSKLQTSILSCERLVDSLSQLLNCPLELGVTESSPVLCFGVNCGPVFVSSVETAQKMNGKHPLMHEEKFLFRTLSGLDDAIQILFKTQAQNNLLAKYLQQ